MLVFLSGILLHRSIGKAWPEYIFGKISGIAWPYFFWSIIFLTVQMMTFPGPSKVVTGIALHSSTYLWFLHFLFIYYIIALVANKLNFNPWLLVALGVLVSFGPEAYRISRFGYLMAFFFLGNIVAARRFDFELFRTSQNGRIILGFSVTFFVISSALSVSGISLRYRPAGYWASISGIILWISIFVWLPQGNLSRVLAWIGKSSLVFYVSHMVAMTVVSRASAAYLGLEFQDIYLLNIVSAGILGTVLIKASDRSSIIKSMFSLTPLRRRSTWLMARFIKRTG